MRTCRLRISITILVAAAALGIAGAASAANYPLELSIPRNGLPNTHRATRAHPGLVYNIRAAVIGGAYPYTHSLSNAPAGMTIDSRTGEINWPNPQGTATTPTLTVIDSEGTRVSATWTIAVGTSGFRFVDGVNGRSIANGGTGTAENPWRTMHDVYNGGRSGEIVYFKNGTYRITNLPRTGAGGVWERVEFSATDRPIMWLAYPGHRPTLDYAWSSSEFGPMVRLDGNNAYIDGFETINSHVMAFQIVGAGAIFRRMRMHNHGPGGDGSNGSLIMTVRNSPQDYMVIQDSELYDSQDVTIKIYAQRKLLIEDNRFYELLDGIELKDDVRQFTVRGNTFITSDMAIGGNMDVQYTSGEILFNNVRATTFAQDVNQNGIAGRIDIYRNTFVGRVQVRNTDSADGPFSFYNNVIVNSDSGTPAGSHIILSSVSAPSRVINRDNLAGYPADGIVDANGNLTPNYQGYFGTHGHQITQGPRPPSNVRITQ